MLSVVDESGLIADGIDLKLPAGFEEEREQAWALQQLVGAVPPRHWSGIWHKTPSEIIRLARRSEWFGALLAGWTLAARRHSDADWAEALLPAGTRPTLPGGFAGGGDGRGS